MKTSQKTIENLYEQIEDMQCVAVPPGTVYEMTLPMFRLAAILDDVLRCGEMEADYEKMKTRCENLRESAEIRGAALERAEADLTVLLPEVKALRLVRDAANKWTDAPGGTIEEFESLTALTIALDDCKGDDHG